MDPQQAIERLTDEQVRERLAELYPKVLDQHARLAQPWTPAPGSALGQDDATAPFSPWPSYLARTSIAIATEHFMMAACWMLNNGPPIFSAHTLLRTVLIGGAQTVWMLSPEDRETRLDRAEAVSRDAYFNHHMWARGLKDAAPESYDVERLPAAREALTGLVGKQRRAELNYTQMIGDAIEHIYSSPPDPTIRASALATWRTLSGVAHALPWEMHTRDASFSVETEGLRTTEIQSSWSGLQEALSLGWAVVDVGWRLLDQRGEAPSDDM